ncbi:MAG: hypothetical protein U9R15_06590 [Chloroflexota bacterium]|nr:hypothetical protein [Chloroflexota bacterium]
MFNKILLIDPKTTIGKFLSRSLSAEGYEVTTAPSPAAARKKLTTLAPNLVIVNSIGSIGQTAAWLAQAEAVEWAAPAILLTEEAEAPREAAETGNRLAAPFAFQDLLLLVQDTLYQRTLAGHTPFRLSAALLEKVEAVLDVLREDLRARCVILSSATGRLIDTAGAVDRGVAISLAALMAGGFSATAQAAQLLGHGETYDSNLQESEGFGLYAIRLHDRLTLSVAFSDKIAVGLVRHYTAQAAIDILEILAHKARQPEVVRELKLDDAFRQTVGQALANILSE